MKTDQILKLKTLFQNLTTRYSQNASTGSNQSHPLKTETQNSQDSKDKTKKHKTFPRQNIRYIDRPTNTVKAGKNFSFRSTACSQKYTRMTLNKFPITPVRIKIG